MRARVIAFSAGVVMLAVLPFALSEFRTVQLATVGAYFIAILGLDVLTGHSGQISLGHGAFMAVGAYTTAILVAHHGVQDVLDDPDRRRRRRCDRPARRHPGPAPARSLPRARDVRDRDRAAVDHQEVRPLHRRLDGHLVLREPAADRTRRRGHDPRAASDEQHVALRADLVDRRRPVRARVVAARLALRPLAPRRPRQRARRGGRRASTGPPTRSPRSASRPGSRAWAAR